MRSFCKSGGTGGQFPGLMVALHPLLPFYCLSLQYKTMLKVKYLDTVEAIFMLI